MAQEIERKFLLVEVPEWLRERAGTRIEQGYLALDEEVEVRLRRAGGECLLTVKAGSGEVREEVEVAIGAGRFEALWPLTEGRRLTKTRRRVAAGPGREAEVDFYEGELAGLVVAEVEFGSERESRDFQPPGWLGRAEITGEERYANRRLAAEGRPRRQAKASPYKLKRGEELGAGLLRVARGRADDALAQLAAAGGADLAEAVHAARKDMKKLRAVLRLAREELGEKRFAAENRRYRDAARLLSQSRDAEVKLETLAALEERFGAEVPSGPVRAWALELEAERDEIAGGDGGEAGKRVEEAIAAIEAGRAEVATWPLSGDSWELIEPGLTRSYRRGRGEMKRALADPAAENVHRWRKRVKDLWYQLRLVRKAWPAVLGETAEQTHALADLLGEHHDLAVLAEDLDGRVALGRPDELATLIERRQEELLEAAFELGRRLFAEKPKAFARRLRAYWRAWRSGAT